MKKITAITMLVILTLSLGMAQAAELSVADWRTQSKEDGSTAYYVTYASDFETHEFEVSEKEFSVAVKERQIENEKEEKAEKNATKRPWWRRVIAFLTFWNPND